MMMMMAFTMSRLPGCCRFLARKSLQKGGGTQIYICGCTPNYFQDVTSRSVPPITVRKYSKFTKPKTDHKYESESDSDVEISKKAGESKFWRQKMRTFHSILDVNKDGVISFDDFQLLADRFVNLGHMSDDKASEFRNLIKKIWEKQWGEIGPYNLVTVEQYLEDMLHVVNDKERAKKVHSFLPYLFEALDKEKNGEIALDGYKLFFECLGLTTEDAVFTFRAIDSDCDGKVSKREFLHHGKEFFLCENQNKISKYFWGPLVEK